MQQPNFEKLVPVPSYWRWMLLGTVAIVGTGVGAVYFTQSQAQTPLQTAAAIQPVKVSALGRLEPQGTVINIAEPSGQGGAYRVDQLLVKVGDRVKAGQVIAVLDNRDRLQAELREAQEQVRVAEAGLSQVKAGAQFGEIAAQQATIARLAAQLRGEQTLQQATIARLQAELQNAQVEYRRHLELYQNGAITASLLDSKALAAKTAQEQVNEAIANLSRDVQTLEQQIREGKATLERIAEVRPTDIAAAQANVDRASAAVNRTQTQLDAAYVRAPQAGRILRIHTRAGEAVSSEGIVELGQTDQMYVVAEVYEADIRKVKIGQTATITADTVVGKLKGTVDQIGWTIAKQDVLNTDPTAAIDARVIEVKIRLDRAASQRVAQLTNLQVNVDIDL